MTDPSALLGTWKMVSWQREVLATGEQFDALGPDPVGFINYGPDGRMFAIVIQKDRAAPAGPVPSDAEKLRLFNSMLAYAGTYSSTRKKSSTTLTLHGIRLGPERIRCASTSYREMS